MAEEINKGDTVKIIVPSIFQGHYTVLERHKQWYKLATTHNGTPYPCWFERHEIERVEMERGSLG